MKKLIVMGIVLAMVMGLAAVASAAVGPNDQWIIYMKVSDMNGTNFLTSSCLFGTKTGATDSPAEASNDANNISGPGNAAVLGCFDLGNGNGLNGFYKDLRAPMAADELKVWDLRIYVQSGWNFGDLNLVAWNPTGTYDVNSSIPISLSVVNDPTGTFAAGTVLMNFDGTKNGVATDPAYSATFSNTGAIKTGSYIDLQLVAGSVPEPGSMLAMFSGLIGLVGFGIRRRK